MYELIILALLIQQPAHGYLIAKIINDMIGPYARISNGRLYPLLSRLEETKLIAIDDAPADTQRGDRQLRSYKITQEGRERFHHLMMDTTSNPGEYSKLFVQKASVLRYMKPAERLYIIDHYINYCQAHVLHLTAEAEDLEHLGTSYCMDQVRLDATLNVMQHLTDQWKLELEWARRLREQEVV